MFTFIVFLLCFGAIWTGGWLLGDVSRFTGRSRINRFAASAILIVVGAFVMWSIIPHPY